MEMTIAKRFCGPPNSGNGGYSSGMLAGFIEGPAEVTLRAPPPLDTRLRVVRENGVTRAWHGEKLIAEAVSADFTLQVPAPPSWDEAEAASKRYAGHRRHDYATCFVCGPERRPDDGLCIFCGPWRDGIVAGTWIPDPSLDDGKGRVRAEFLWAAIDCPGSWSVIGVAAQWAPSSSMLLGRLTGRLLHPVQIGEACIVIGWPLGRDGRKHHVGSAVYTRAGALAAYSKGTWIELKS